MTNRERAKKWLDDNGLVIGGPLNDSLAAEFEAVRREALEEAAQILVHEAEEARAYAEKPGISAEDFTLFHMAEIRARRSAMAIRALTEQSE